MIFYSLLLLVLLSPLPYATNRPWSWSLWAIIIALLVITWAIKMLIVKSKQHTYQQHQPLSFLIISFLLVIFWGGVQTLTTIPQDWIHPIWPMMNQALAVDIPGSISLNRDDTLTSIMRLISYGLVFCLSQYYCRDRDKAHKVLFSIMLAGLLYSAYGLIIYFGGFKPLLGHNQQINDALTSTFINRNHFASYAGLSLLCTLALLSEGAQISSRYNLGGYIGMQRFLENLITRTWLPLLAFFIIGTALILTHSRGGFFSTLLAITLLLIAFNSKSQTRNIQFLAIASVFMVLGSFIFWMSGDILTSRLDQIFIDDNNYRLKAYQLTWQAITDNPWLGYGLGCFQEAFALYKTSDIAGSQNQPLVWDYAHNTYLETLFELGIPAACGLFFCFLQMAWACVRGLLTRKRDLLFPATGLAATTLIAAHALVDFSIQIPAVAYTYALLMGVAWAQSFSSRPTEKKSQ